MIDTLKRILIYIGVFCGLIIVFNLSLLLVSLIPKELVVDNVKETSETLLEEGQSYELIESLKIFINTQTDAVIANEIYSTNNKTPFISYMTSRKNFDEDFTQKIIEETTGEGITANYNNEADEEIVDDSYNSVGELADFLDGKIHTAINYGRYWHGYWLIYRPLFIFFNIVQIRKLFFVIFAILLAISTRQVYKKYDFNLAIIYASSFILSSYFSASYSLESSPIFIITMIYMIVLLNVKNKIKNPYLMFFILGMVVNFVDYFTVPLIPFFVPMIFLLIDYKKEHSLTECIFYIIKCGINYAISYAGTWVLKWALYDLFISSQTSMLKIGFVQSFYRMSRENKYIIPGQDMAFHMKRSLLRYSFYTTMVFLVLSLRKDVIDEKDENVSQNKKKKSLKTISNIDYIFLIFAFCPIVWFFITQNHTLLHIHFTFRMYVIYMLGILVFLRNRFLNTN